MKKQFLLNMSCLTAFAVSGVALFLATNAQAQARDFNIPLGTLADALSAYEATTGQSLILGDLELSGRTSPGARGALTPQQALAQILSGAGLKSCPADGRVAIVEAIQACGSVSRAGEATQVADVIVTGTAVSHLADRSRTGTRMDADPMTLPLTVSSVDSRLLERQQSVSLSDAVANVAGVSGGADNSFSTRGFSTGVMRNGSLSGDGTAIEAPLIAVSRLEVVKGPEAIIAGVTAGYGGVVNVITKTPPMRRTAEVASTIGTRGYYDVGFDVGGPLNEGKNILMRLVGSTQDADRSAAGYDASSVDYLAPSITLRKPEWGTELTAQYEYQDIRRAPDLVAYTDKDRLDDDAILGRVGPKDDGVSIESRVATLSLEQRISEDWSLAVRYTHDERDRSTRTGLHQPAVGDFLGYPFLPNVFMIGYVSTAHIEVENTKFEVRGRFDTGPIEHKLLMAYDETSTNVVQTGQLTSVRNTNLQTGEMTDLTAEFGPMFGAPSGVFGGGIAPEENGLLLLDQMTWGKLVVLAGWRRMEYAPHDATGKLGTFEKSLPSLGVLYRLTPDISIYGSASKGFTPNLGYFDTAGTAIPPEDAQQYEVGVKALLFGERVAASASVFSIDQKNVAVSDPGNIDPICEGASGVCYISVPGVKSKGFEVEVSGEILPRLEVRANYSYTDKDAESLDQAGITYAPHQASLWATYRLGQGDQGWWVGGGARYRSDQEAGPIFYIANPGGTRLDLNAGYDADRWSFVGGVKNVTDERLYTIGSGASGTGVISQPREWFATLRYRFN